jgi:hypothetical protein
MTNDCPHEETDDPLYVDRRNFYKVEKDSRLIKALRLRFLILSLRAVMQTFNVSGSRYGKATRLLGSL